MASIGGLTSSTSSSVNSLKGYGGLASGLDRDSLIEAMTSGTQSKIQKQKQAKQKVEWQQEIIRNITNKMYAFSEKYLTYSSSTNLLSSSFFSRNDITSQGVNGKYVSISGSSNTIDDISILGVKQLAKNAQATSTVGVSGSGSTIEGSKAVDASGTIDTSKLAGQIFRFKLGDAKEFIVTVPNDVDFGLDSNGDPIDAGLKAINDAIEKELKEQYGESYDKEVKFELNADGYVKITNTTGNKLTFVTGDDMFRSLGIIEADESVSDIKLDDQSGNIIGKHQIKKEDLVSSKDKIDVLKETVLTFNYNGETKKISLENVDFTDDKKTTTNIKEVLQKELNKAYGNNRIKVDLDSSTGGLKFTTIDPSTGNDDNTSSLTIVGSSMDGVLGKDGILGLEVGASNRLNTNKTVDELGIFQNLSGNEGIIKINDEEIKFTKNTTLQELMDDIKEKTGITISYLSTTDRITMTSSEQGASSIIKFDTADANSKDLMTFFKLGELTNKTGTGIVGEGQDALMTVEYKNTGQVVDIKRGSNSFKLDGLDVSLTGTFGTYRTESEGVDKNGSWINRDASINDAVTFSAKANVDEVTTAVKEMIDGFNEILSLVNTTVNEKQSSSDKYEPLTDQQREEMTESQITEWEKKAKVGILYNDTELRGLASALRFVLPSGEARKELEDIGITVSSDYGDNGKLVFDETKFKKAMETNPDKVKELIAGFASDGTKTSNGLMNNIQNVMDQYAKTTGATKGILIQRAGSTNAPLSVTQNSMQKQIDSIQKMIEQLQDRLESEQSRYISQFTRLETVIANMNAQSSWLSQLQ